MHDNYLSTYLKFPMLNDVTIEAYNSDTIAQAHTHRSILFKGGDKYAMLLILILYIQG